jgi:hypothetical protein
LLHPFKLGHHDAPASKAGAAASTLCIRVAGRGAIEARAADDDAGNDEPPPATALIL